MPAPPLTDALRDAYRQLVRLDDVSSAWQTFRLLREGPSRNKEQIAAELGMSGRHLARKLDREGLTFRQVRDAALLELAAEHIGAGMTLAAVAEVLGFHDQSAFACAFRRWTGLSPGQFRDSVRQTDV